MYWWCTSTYNLDRHTVVCPSLISQPSYTHISTQRNGPGTVVTFSCDIGYTLVGGPSITCLGDGTWSPSILLCQESEYEWVGVVVKLMCVRPSGHFTEDVVWGVWSNHCKVTWSFMLSSLLKKSAHCITNNLEQYDSHTSHAIHHKWFTHIHVQVDKVWNSIKMSDKTHLCTCE